MNNQNNYSKELQKDKKKVKLGELCQKTRGGSVWMGKMWLLFGEKTEEIIEELNEVLAA